MTKSLKQCFFNSNFKVTAFILLFVCACQRHDYNAQGGVVPEPSPRLQSSFEKTRLVCFSRFLIQIPDTATVVYGPTEVEAPIFVYLNESHNLEAHLDDLQKEIEEDRAYLLKDDIPNFPLFGKVIDGVIPGQKIVFGTKDQVNYTIHSLIPVGDTLFIQEFRTPSAQDELKIINELANNIRLRPNDEIPGDIGMCIDNGFVTSENKYERTTIGIRLTDFPDVHISIDAHKNLDYLPVGSNPIELRKQAKVFAEADGLGAVFASTKILRQGPRQLGIWSGEELALRTPPYKENKSVHEFRFHSMGAVNDPLLPELDIRLDSGVKDNGKGRIEPSITDEEALTLWDKIITTIRIRKPSDATPPKEAKIPLASQVTTGKVCPQAGWWECAEKRRVEGDKRRLVKSGDPMPHVWIIEESSFWNKLIGNRRMRPVETTWRLVAYEDPPLAG